MSVCTLRLNPVSDIKPLQSDKTETLHEFCGQNLLKLLKEHLTSISGLRWTLFKCKSDIKPVLFCVLLVTINSGPLFFLPSHPPSLRPHSLIQCQPSPAVSDPSARSLSSGWRWDSSEDSFCWPSPSSPPPDRKQVSVPKLWEKKDGDKGKTVSIITLRSRRENSVSQDSRAPIRTFCLHYYLSISFNKSWSALGIKKYYSK